MGSLLQIYGSEFYIFRVVERVFTLFIQFGKVTVKPALRVQVLALQHLLSLLADEGVGLSFTDGLMSFTIVKLALRLEAIFEQGAEELVLWS